MNRIIGKHEGEAEGPLFIAIGAMHGNEPAGVKAIETMLQMLIDEPKKNPTFSYKGTFLGIIGNLQAFKKKQRFIERDLNRQWTLDNVEAARKGTFKIKEWEEIAAIVAVVEQAIEQYNPPSVVVLDIHTTTAFGGIFSIPAEQKMSLDIAVALHAPVITGMLKGIQGTSLHYFKTKYFDRPVHSVVFESGQHTEPLAVNRAIAGITNCMRTIGAVKPTDVESRHDIILKEYAAQLPKVCHLEYCHAIKKGDNFKMQSGFKNFQAIQRGTLLAKDKNGELYAEMDCRVLMPLYQKQGEDGYFLIKDVEHNQ